MAKRSSSSFLRFWLVVEANFPLPVSPCRHGHRRSSPCKKTASRVAQLTLRNKYDLPRQRSHEQDQRRSPESASTDHQLPRTHLIFDAITNQEASGAKAKQGQEARTAHRGSRFRGWLADAQDADWTRMARQEFTAKVA